MRLDPQYVAGLWPAAKAGWAAADKLPDGLDQLFCDLNQGENSPSCDIRTSGRLLGNDGMLPGQPDHDPAEPTPLLMSEC
jgi:hypothetical protein